MSQIPQQGQKLSSFEIFNPNQKLRKLPPFGKILAAYQAESISLEWQIYVYVGKDAKNNAYVAKRQGSLATYLPYGDDYKAYKWPVHEQKIVMQDTGGMNQIELVKFSFYLLNNGARVVFLYSDEYPHELYLPKGRTSFL